MRTPLVENFTPDVMGGRVVDELPEVRSHSGFAAADVDVEHLHTFQLVDDVLALPRGQLTRIAFARGRQAVHAGQVAGVGELPGQADRRVQAALELLDQPGYGLLRWSSGLPWRPASWIGPARRGRADRAPAAHRRFRRRGKPIGHRGVDQATRPPRRWCDSSETTACGFRSDRAAPRTARAAQPPGGAVASAGPGRTAPPPVGRHGGVRGGDRHGQ